MNINRMNIQYLPIKSSILKLHLGTSSTNFNMLDTFKHKGDTRILDLGGQKFFFLKKKKLGVNILF